MKIKNVLILSMVAMVGLTMTSCFEEKDLTGPIVDPQLNLTVLDANGDPVSGATVDLFANKDDYRKFNNVLGSATTDANGVVTFDKATMKESGLFYFSVKSGDDRNWYNLVNKGLTVSNGVSMIETTLTPVTLSTAISGPMQVISSTSGKFELADFPGKYQWSFVSGGEKGTIDDPTNNNVNVSFEQSDVDYDAVLQVVAQPDGFPETTMQVTIKVLAFCEYDHTKLAGDRPGNDMTNWVLGAYASQINIKEANGSFTITGLGNGWMEDFWAEAIQNKPNYVSMEVSDDGLFITIPDQYYFTTIYNGDPYDYNIVGSGSVNGCTGEITFNYDMVQDGFSTGGWSLGAGGSTNGSPFWEAKVTFTP